jgi:NAD(P)-dependent dehydrogenase (short-subunit alcohol dehydrogenase family)
MNTMTDVALVVGASRGLGRGIAIALAEAGMSVVGVSRTAPSDRGVPVEVADAADPATAGRLLDRYDPRVVVLVAGAVPPVRPLHQQTWETFSVNWHADVKIAFHWLSAALRKPMRPGGRMVVISSGAALAGSPLSGGYAGAKATQRFIAGYAQDEADRAGLDLTVTTVLPRITPLTDVGREAVTAYAARNGQTEAEYVGQFGPPLTPEMAGKALVELVQADAFGPGYLLDGTGLRPLA